MPMVLGMGRRRKNHAPEADDQIFVAQADEEIFIAPAEEEIFITPSDEPVPRRRGRQGGPPPPSRWSRSSSMRPKSLTPETRPVPRQRSRRGVARILLSLFLIVGLASAVFAGWQWKNVQARQARQSFHAQASGVAAKVTKALQRDIDLTTTSRALIEQNPNITNVQLGSLFSTLAPSGPANSSGITYIEKVSSDQLYYYRVAIATDPTSALSAGAALCHHPEHRAGPVLPDPAPGPAHLAEECR